MRCINETNSNVRATCLIGLPFIDPATITIAIVVKFTTVNTLFKIDDSLTPTHNRAISSITIPKAKKSGYSDKKGTSIGIRERVVLPMTFPVSALI